MNTEQARPDDSINDVIGTHFLAEIGGVSYSQIVEAFGEPNAKSWDEYKIDAEWWLSTPAGPATLYNYKPELPQGIPITDVHCWHIGGQTSGVLRYVTAPLGATAYTHRLDPKTHQLIYERADADADGQRTWDPECRGWSAAVRGMLIAAASGIAGGALYAAINTRMQARSSAAATNGRRSREKAHGIRRSLTGAQGF